MKEIQLAMDQAGIAIHWIDADSGHFIYINERCCEMLGYSREELLTMSIPDIDPNFPRGKGTFGTLTASLRKQGAGKFETVNKHKDGRLIPIETSFHYRESPDGKEKHFIAFVVDISQRKQAEMALYTLNQTLEKRVQEGTAKHMEQERLLIQQSRLAAMGEMVGNIAHQWRQPLTSVGLILQNIGFDYEDNLLTGDALKTYISEGLGDVRQMSGTIDDFRNFFLPNKEKKHFPVSAPVKEAIKLVSQSFIKNNIEITLDECDESYAAFGYPNEFAQVILNILNNTMEAIVAKGSHGKVHIHAEKEKDSITISIRDNGGGIPEETLPKIFDPYFTTKAMGTGIGLYMSKMIMGNMGGDIVIRNVEGGAEVLLTLPLEEQA